MCGLDYGVGIADVSFFFFFFLIKLLVTGLELDVLIAVRLIEFIFSNFSSSKDVCEVYCLVSIL